MSNKFWKVNVTHADILNGYFPKWKDICVPDTWTVDASHFSSDGAAAFAILCPSGRLITHSFTGHGSAPEMLGVIEAVKMIPEFANGTVETDQLSVASITYNKRDRSHALRLAFNSPHWEELAALLRIRHVTIKYVAGHGKRSNARMAVVDAAARKAARGPVQWV